MKLPARGSEPTPEEQAVLDGLPDAPDPAFLRSMRFVDFLAVERHSDRLNPKQRAAYDVVQAESMARLQAVFKTSPSYKKLFETHERTAAKFKAGLLKPSRLSDLAAKSKPIIPASRDRSSPEDFASKLFERQVAEAKRLRDERAAEVERDQAMLATLGDVLDQIVQQNKSGSHVVALTRATVLFALIAVVVSAVVGVWTFSQAWDWTLLAGIASLGLGLLAAGALGVFRR